MYILRSDIHWVKHAKIRASSDPYFLVYYSALIRENTNSILIIYGEIRIGESPHFDIFFAVIRKK